VKIVVVLFNLGGPDSLEVVEPFLTNLFSDPAILPVPRTLRVPLARLIAKRRGPIARDIYAKIGGHSPILEETQKQASALEAALSACGHEAKAVIVMRAWRPFASEAVEQVRHWSPDRIVLLPLYPQFSMTTTGSSLDDWIQTAKSGAPTAPQLRICCYPWLDGFIAAEVALISKALEQRMAGVDYRLLLSAHSLPKRVISRGDPYRWQVEKTAQAIADRLGTIGLDWQLCYQSRVGPLEWIGPATDVEIRRAGADHKGIVVAPIAFLCEHSETLVELDIEYAKLAREAGVLHYVRVPTVGTHPSFIAGLAEMVLRAIGQDQPVTCGHGRICPAELAGCGYEGPHV